jgi:signal transduction histidine kinase
VESVQGTTAGEEPVEQDLMVAKAIPPADELRERLLSFMVHEIRNPLASTLWSAEMLARKPLGDGRNDRLAQLASRSVRRLRMLLEDLFALERVPLHPTTGQVRLGAAIDRALAPRDLEPGGLKASIEGPTDLVVNHEPVLLDRMLHACFRRISHISGSDETITARVNNDEGRVSLEICRMGVSPRDIEPPPMTTGGSEGEGTTFAMLLARAVAQRIGVTLRVVPNADGAAILISFPS